MPSEFESRCLMGMMRVPQLFFSHHASHHAGHSTWPEYSIVSPVLEGFFFFFFFPSSASACRRWAFHWLRHHGAGHGAPASSLPECMDRRRAQYGTALFIDVTNIIDGHLLRWANPRVGLALSR